MRKRLTYVKPINVKEVKDLDPTEYLLIYMDKDNNLKRAFPDFCETIMDYKDSLILEAIDSDKVSAFKIIMYKEEITFPTFSITTLENGNIVSYNCMGGDIKLENLLHNYKRNVPSKVLKKNI